MNIYALQTARAGSKSIINKNVLMIGDKPLFLHNLLYAKESKYISQVYVSTNIHMIFKFSLDYNYHTIRRPNQLCKDSSSHYEAICHGMRVIEDREQTDIDILVILLGNNLSAYTDDLDKGIKYLIDNDVDSVMSVSRFDMFNPFRAYKKKEGLLDTIVSQSFIKENQKNHNINDKKAAGPVYFFNGSFWIVRKKSILENNGLLPFAWLGKKIYPLVQKDAIELDAEWQISYLKEIYGKSQ